MRNREEAATVGNLLLVGPMRLAVAILAAAGCVEPSPELSPPVDPPPAGETPVVAFGEPHHVRTHFDLELDALLADPTVLTQTLRAFESEPGTTMLALAADSPQLATLRAELPAALEDNLATWIDDAVPALGLLAIHGVRISIESEMAAFDLESRLSSDDAITGHHELVAWTSRAYGHRFEIAAGEGHAADMQLAKLGYALTIGGHDLAVATGGFAWDSVNTQAAERGGVRGMLGGATQCEYVATVVAAQSGHRDTLQAVCEAALDELAARSRSDAQRLRFQAHLEGSAGLDDADRDEVSDGFFGGEWQMQLDAGEGAIAVTQSFD